MSYAGIASATGTRLDSASKHTMACKLDDFQHINWHQNPAEARKNLQTNKYRFAMLKDELVLNVSQRLHGASKNPSSGAKAYPAVVTSTGAMPWIVKAGLTVLYSSEDGQTFMHRRNLPGIIGTSEMSEHYKDKQQKEFLDKMWDEMPYFTAQGYALGTAWASPHSGDTVGTVLVGGMVLVRNGAFACRAGQPVMFYFDFEEMNFCAKQHARHNTPNQVVYEGEREQLNPNSVFLSSTEEKNEDKRHSKAGINDSEKSRKRARLLEYDQYNSAQVAGKRGIALPKPYVLYNGKHHYGDKIRVFAKCINGGRAHDMIDLMLMTQSL